MQECVCMHACVCVCVHACVCVCVRACMCVRMRMHTWMPYLGQGDHYLPNMAHVAVVIDQTAAFHQVSEGKEHHLKVGW